jgi:GR25 family glycosyltransferase involved in LPS biosynthesis
LNIPIYVIAIEGSSRIESFKIEATNQEINYEIHRAVNGNDLSESEILKLYNLEATYARLGYQINKSQIGCALSHKQVYKKALESDSDWVVILEEDVQLQSQFRQSLEILISSLNAERAIICQLFTRGERFVRKKTIKKIADNRFIFEFASMPGQTASYLINRKALLMGSTEEAISGPADWPNWTTSITFFGIFPYLVFESGQSTSINSPLVSRKQYWMQSLGKFSGLHFIKYRKYYLNLKSYWKIEVRPLVIRILWRFKGKPTFPQFDSRGLWII